jgi:dihydroorotate dehydrogenase electron transfer subunit
MLYCYNSQKKYTADWTVRQNTVRGDICHLRLVLDDRSDLPFPEFWPGQFVQVRIDGRPSTFLRRPISVHFVDPAVRELRLLVQIIGDGTRAISELKPGQTVNIVYPLGKAFSLPAEAANREWRYLLVGGGVGAAPLLYLGYHLAKLGCALDFIIGASTCDNLVDTEKFKEYGNVYITTDDGSAGVKGFVTDHPALSSNRYGYIYTCGPRPMMKAVAKYAAKNNIPCEVSLENTMACGIGACLCCVEKDAEGNNKCVCTDGPVFAAKDLGWG